jgi:pullulanase/glycogen debranching enzyme
MFRAGDEFLNTQFGNNNPYNQDNEIGWLDWNQLRSSHVHPNCVRSVHPPNRSEIALALYVSSDVVPRVRQRAVRTNFAGSERLRQKAHVLAWMPNRRKMRHYEFVPENSFVNAAESSPKWTV